MVVDENFTLLQNIVLEEFRPGDLVGELFKNLEYEFVFGSARNFKEAFDLLDGCGFVSNNQVARLDCLKVFVLLTLVSVLVKGSIVLCLSNLNFVDGPNLGIGVEPVI